jgi:hypothetical protein
LSYAETVSPFIVTVHPTSHTVAPLGHLLVTLTGHLTFGNLTEALREASAVLGRPGPRVSVLFDCLTMTGYDRVSREAFVDWHRAHKARIDRVAILTSNPLWHLVISAMSLAAKTPMGAFSTRKASEEWLMAASSSHVEPPRSIGP